MQGRNNSNVDETPASFTIGIRNISQMDNNHILHFHRFNLYENGYSHFEKSIQYYTGYDFPLLILLRDGSNAVPRNGLLIVLEEANYLCWSTDTHNILVPVRTSDPFGRAARNALAYYLDSL